MEYQWTPAPPVRRAAGRRPRPCDPNYPVDDILGVLKPKVNFWPNVDAQRRETLMHGEALRRFRHRTERFDEQEDNKMAERKRRCSGVNELPSVALTTKFLGLCEQYGAERLAVRVVATGRSAGVPGLPEDDDWTAWNADEMRAAVEHLQRKRGA